jgi:hypothetical protein
MWRYVVAAGLLSGGFLAIGQQAEVNAEPGNTVPEESLSRALKRALAPRNGLSTPTLPMRALRQLPPAPSGQGAKVCAVPLLETRGTETKDRIAHPAAAPSIDSKMVHAPPVPACRKP